MGSFVELNSELSMILKMNTSDASFKSVDCFCDESSKVILKLAARFVDKKIDSVSSLQLSCNELRETSTTTKIIGSAITAASLQEFYTDLWRLQLYPLDTLLFARL